MDSPSDHGSDESPDQHYEEEESPYGDEEEGEYEGQHEEGAYDEEYEEQDEHGDYYADDHGEGIEDDEDHEEGDVIMEQHSRKVKRDLQENLNRVRRDKGFCKLYADLFSMLIANEYAEFLKTNEHEADIFKSLCEDYNIFGDVKLVYTISKFEEDTNIGETFHQDFLDLGYLLLEVESDRKVLLEPNSNHIGIGVAMTPENLVLVEVFSQKLLAITKISDGEDGGIEVRGKMLTTERGLYAVRLQSLEAKKDYVIGPENIEFDKNTKDFIVFLDVEESVGSSNKIIEFYVRVKPDTIEYKKASKEKLNLKHLELAHRCPCITFPDPRYLQEDEMDRVRKEQDALEMMRRQESSKRLQNETMLRSITKLSKRF